MNQAILNIDKQIFLMGRPPIGEFLGFVRTTAIDGQSRDLTQLAAQWQAANAHLNTLTQTESGIADNIKIKPLPKSLLPLCKRITEHETFKPSYGFTQTQFGLVELDRLVVHQKYINWSYVEVLRAKIGEKPSLLKIAKLVFNEPRSLPIASDFQSAANSFTFSSPSIDLRYLNAYLLRPENIKAEIQQGFPSKTMCVEVGFGSNLLSALLVNGRLILNNGSHRAVALRSLGVTHVPCLVQNIPSQDMIELVGPEDLKTNPARYLGTPRPPLLKDYFDEQLRIEIDSRRKQRMVKVSFGVEITDIPM